ncbi:MAG: hypothetical protein HKN43_10970 [Rhodothermales bacterium]|nr:hypothetical protein [Rhodothermales bacterium]
MTRHFLLLIVAVSIVGIHSAVAQDTDTADVFIGFDDIEEEAPPAVSHSGGWTDMIHISGRFDLNLEVTNPSKEFQRTSQFRNYHKFIFLNVKPDDRIALEAEILDLSYYEIKYRVWREFELRFGKIWVPFGATPFHHYYGGIQGDPFQGLFLPNVWSEFGGTIGGTIFTGNQVQIDVDLFAIRGFETELGNVLNLSNGGADDTYAFGQRTRLGFGKISLWGSALYNQFGLNNDGHLVLWGGDLLVDYGLVNAPILKDLKLRVAFARADIKDQELVEERFNTDGWYYRYGDYAELTYRGLPHVSPRVRYGTIVDYDDVVTNNDSHNTEFAALVRINRNLSVLMQYQLNMEEVNEIDNDLFRIHAVFEF